MSFKPFTKEQLKQGRKDYYNKVLTEDEFISKFGFNPKANYSFFITSYFYSYEKKESIQQEGGLPKFHWYLLTTTQKPNTHLTMEWAVWATDVLEAANVISSLQPNDKISLRIERVLMKHSDDDPPLCGKKWDEKFIVRWVGKAK